MASYILLRKLNRSEIMNKIDRLHDITISNHIGLNSYFITPIHNQLIFQYLYLTLHIISLLKFYRPVPEELKKTFLGRPHLFLFSHKAFLVIPSMPESCFSLYLS